MLDDDGIIEAAAKSVLLGVQGGEASSRVTCDVSCTHAVDGDAISNIAASTPEISRIDPSAGGTQFGGEAIRAAAAKSVLLGVQRGEASCGKARHVHCALAVDGEPIR